MENKKKIHSVLGEQKFDTSVTFQDSEGKRSYGAWGRPVVFGTEIIGLQADDPEYSWGYQMDGSYIEPSVHYRLV